MAARQKTATVQLKVRMKEPLRAQLEKAAKARGVSINADVVDRLENSFRYQEDVFGGRRTFILMKLAADIFHIVEENTGKRWDDDEETFELAINKAKEIMRSIATDKRMKRKIARRSLLHGYTKEELQ